MSFQKVAWVCALSALLVIGTRDARAAQIRFDVLRQSGWEPYIGFTPGPEAGPDYSLKVFDQAGTLQMESRPGYGYNKGTLKVSTLEDLKTLNLRVEYTPNSSAETSVYQFTLDAPDWSSASLPAPRPSVSAATLEAGQSLNVTWPVYAQGTAGVQAYVLPSSGPFKILYEQRPAYSAGGLVTDPLPAGYGYVELDYTQPMPGALTGLQRVSGPDAGLQPAADVQYYSWQGAGFTVTPEPTALGGIGLALTVLRRRQRRA
jgi:hypothetical protein